MAFTDVEMGLVLAADSVLKDVSAMNATRRTKRESLAIAVLTPDGPRRYAPLLRLAVESAGAAPTSRTAWRAAALTAWDSLSGVIASERA